MQVPSREPYYIEVDEGEPGLDTFFLLESRDRMGDLPTDLSDLSDHQAEQVLRAAEAQDPAVTKLEVRSVLK